MRHKLYNVHFTVAGWEQLGLVMGLLAGEVTNIEVRETTNTIRARTRGATVPEKCAWVSRYKEDVLSILRRTNAPIHYKKVGEQLVAAGRIGKVSTASSILSELTRLNIIARVSKGRYRIPASVTPISKSSEAS